MRLFNTAYLHLSKAVVVLAMFTLVAFYPRYLTVITSPLPWYMHAHFVLMIIWMSMLFLQPRFVGKKDFAKHRAFFVRAKNLNAPSGHLIRSAGAFVVSSV